MGQDKLPQLSWSSHVTMMTKHTKNVTSLPFTIYSAKLVYKLLDTIRVPEQTSFYQFDLTDRLSGFIFHSSPKTNLVTSCLKA